MNDLDVARRAARTGAAVVAEGFRTVRHADFKGVVDPVTETDRAAEAAITDVLRSARPDDGILAEEGTSAASASGRRWIIDPLDGTVNFLHGIPQVAVSIALYDGDRGLVGVVVDPLRGEEYTAAAGEGCLLNGEPIRVSTRHPIGDALIVTGYPYDRRRHGPAYAAVVGAVLQAARGVRRLGSAALDLAWVAAGRFDGYWEFGLAPWDLAAGAILVAEAGGSLSDSRGGPAHHLDVVASNGLIHDELMRVVAAHRPPHLEPRGGEDPRPETPPH